MQSLRSVLLACVAAILVSPLLVKGEDTDAQAKARQALEQAMQMSQPQPPPAQPAPTKKKPAKKTPPPAPPVSAAPQKSSPPPQAKPEAPVVLVEPTQPAPATPGEKQMDFATLRQKVAEPWPEGNASAPPSTATPRASKSQPLTFTPMEAPESPIPASKEQQLQQLLDQYRADQITPQDYHEKRAKILSEP